jgi:hypothetical protein
MRGKAQPAAASSHSRGGRSPLAAPRATAAAGPGSVEPCAGRTTLGVAGGRGDLKVHPRGGAMLHPGVGRGAQLGFLARALRGQAGRGRRGLRTSPHSRALRPPMQGPQPAPLQPRSGGSDGRPTARYLASNPGESSLRAAAAKALRRRHRGPGGIPLLRIEHYQHHPLPLILASAASFTTRITPFDELDPDEIQAFINGLLKGTAGRADLACSSSRPAASQHGTVARRLLSSRLAVANLQLGKPSFRQNAARRLPRIRLGIIRGIVPLAG